MRRFGFIAAVSSIAALVACRSDYLPQAASASADTAAVGEPGSASLAATPAESTAAIAGPAPQAGEANGPPLNILKSR